MLFHSLQFAIFFPIVYTLYLVLRHKMQNRMLLLASYIFYGAWDWRYLSLLLASTLVDYLCGLGIEANENDKIRKRFVAISVLANGSLLCVFKYYDFFAESFQDLMGGLGMTVHPYFLNIALPIGISFYTFQTMSYTIDVYRRKLKPARNIFDFALYVSFFPQLIAGPIERGTRLLPQILTPRKISIDDVYVGIYLFVWGFFLKVFVADNLSLIVEPVFAQPGPHAGGQVLLATYAFSFQIYADFAGYSFMAIGLARMMGIELMENFRRPYFSVNIAEFWRRWHISLSSWFRDYVFSPFYMYLERHPKFAGLSIKTRHGIAFFVALLVAEFMLGLWHGAGWNFAAFGVYHALAIWAYYAIRKHWDRMPMLLQVFLTWQVACLGWLIFASPSLGVAWELVGSIGTSLWQGFGTIDAGSFAKVISLITIVLLIQLIKEKYDDSAFVFQLSKGPRYAFYAVLVILMLVFGDIESFTPGGTPARPFIYFQF